jgi:molybdopterin converting factor small subunit
MKVFIPSPLRSYTNRKEVEATGSTVAELLMDLDRQYPGIRFRIVDEQDNIRQHMRLFVNEEQVFDLNFHLRTSDAIYLVQALSGGRK